MCARSQLSQSDGPCVGVPFFTLKLMMSSFLIRRNRNRNRGGSKISSAHTSPKYRESAAKRCARTEIKIANRKCPGTGSNRIARVVKLGNCYLEGLKTIWPQSQGSGSAASPNFELCLAIVNPDVLRWPECKWIAESGAIVNHRSATNRT